MEDPRYSVSEDGTLRIAPMSDTDLGVYECMAKSPTGEVKSRSAKMIYNKQNCESLISYLLCSQEKPKFWLYYFTWDNLYYIYWKFTGQTKDESISSLEITNNNFQNLQTQFLIQYFFFWNVLPTLLYVCMYLLYFTNTLPMLLVGYYYHINNQW